jgi:hypothetical protein
MMLSGSAVQTKGLGVGVVILELTAAPGEPGEEALDRIEPGRLQRGIFHTLVDLQGGSQASYVELSPTGRWTR